MCQGRAACCSDCGIHLRILDNGSAEFDANGGIGHIGIATEPSGCGEREQCLRGGGGRRLRLRLRLHRKSGGGERGPPLLGLDGR